ncbi:hypothetical protein KL938_003762 [Ogataea parapolymorpha]|nr:hypothetical protein KL938_003762 [Ogataea parapolymorpha]
MIVFLLRKGPKLLVFLLLVVNVFLLAFLLVGCTNSSSQYSNVYLIEYKFNQSSAFYSKIENAYSNSNNDDLTSMRVYVGYRGICVKTDNATSCSTNFENTNYKEAYPGVSLYNTDANSTSSSLSLVDMAVKFNTKVTQPYILMASLVLTLFLLANLLYGCIPLLPWKWVASYTSFALSSILCILWGIGGMWVDVAAKSGAVLGATASMTIIEASIGHRAAAMIWCSFSFYVVSLVCTSVGLGKQIRSKQESLEKDSKSLASSMPGAFAGKNPFTSGRVRQFV